MLVEKKFRLLLALLIFLNLCSSGVIWYLYRLLRLRIPQIFLVAPYSPAEIIIDANNGKGAIHPFWLGFAQGGEERGGMLGSTVEKMRSLKPRYVRLDHIFDDDYYGVVTGSSGNLQFDWSRLDKEVDSILAMGAKPFLSLSYMPGAISSSKTDVPSNWDDWFVLVKGTVEHFSGKQNRNIAEVYYEVWNEPDLELFGGWKRGGEKNYLVLYEYAARGAMASSNTQNFYLGGPATTDLYEGWVKDLYSFCRKKNLRLDFLSWHLYSHDVNTYSTQIANIYSWFEAGLVPKLVISEWGPTPEKDESYSSSYAATHAFAATRQLLDLINLATVFEIKDGPEQGNEGWGLLTHENAGLSAKPRFYAFSWLAQVKGERLFLTGEGSNVKAWATKEGNKLTVFLVNFGQGAMPEKVPIQIDNLGKTKYRLDREILFGKKDITELQIGESGSLKIFLDLAQNQVGRIILTSL